MKSLFGRKTPPLQVIGKDEAEALIRAAFAPKRIRLKDKRYCLLAPHDMKDLVYAAFDDTWLVYGWNTRTDSESYPDCDEYSLCARADVTRGAIKRGLPHAPLFCDIDFTPPNGCACPPTPLRILLSS